MQRTRRLASCLSILLSVAIAGWGQPPSVSTRDCVTTRYITGTWTNSQGSQIAYAVRSPNLATNVNDNVLYVKAIDDSTRSNGKPIFSGAGISDVIWTNQDSRLAFIAQVGARKKIVMIDLAKEGEQSVIEADGNIDSFTMDAEATTVAYSVSDGGIEANSQSEMDKAQSETGYRVDYAAQTIGGFGTSAIYMRHASGTNSWTAPQIITIENPFTHVKATHLDNPANLSLSPDGKKLFLTYMSVGVPDEWNSNPFVKYVVGLHASSEIMVLYDVADSTTTLPVKMIYCFTKPRWSRDGHSIFIEIHSPVGSRWESEDIRDKWVTAKDRNLFEIRIDTGEVQEVIRHVPYRASHEGPLFITPDGDLLSRSSFTTVSRMHRDNGSWKEVGTIDLPSAGGDWFWMLATNGKEIVGVHEALSSPEDIFTYKQGDPAVRLLTDLNPELRQVTFAPAQTIEWATLGGLRVRGILFMPAGYVQGKRYPLVIQTKGDAGWFTCDSGANRFPSFAPQPIASAGMMYLVRTTGEDYNYQDDLDKIPAGYPGGIGEVVQQMNIWDDAVAYLADRGLVDPTKVGIIGFSATGSQVEFDLVHGRTKYAAASVTDNEEYSLSEYWLYPMETKSHERMFGGPPYGQTLEDWKKYSISFNLDRIHTPILMEEVGYDLHAAGEGFVSRNLARHSEDFIGLEKLDRAVDMYYYPAEGHEIDHPIARLSNLTRNVDWFRFWLQGYGDPAPAKAEQYRRWETLCEMQRADNPNQLTYCMNSKQ